MQLVNLFRDHQTARTASFRPPPVQRDWAGNVVIPVTTASAPAVKDDPYEYGFAQLPEIPVSSQQKAKKEQPESEDDCVFVSSCSYDGSQVQPFPTD